MTLGVSMIVKNESECIKACLDSLKGFDELVIVDTGSEDNTVEICKEYGADVYFQQWEDDFAKARNYSLEQCDADWVLIIDADEVLRTPVSQIKSALEKTSEKYLGVIVDVQTQYELIKSIRLIRNIEEITWKGEIHNQLVYSEGNLRERCFVSSFKIESGFSPAHLKDPDRTLRILQRQLEKDPNNTRALYYIAREYINRADEDKVIEYLTKYFGIAFYQLWTNELADACYLLALAYMQKHIEKYNKGEASTHWHEAVTWAAMAVLVMPNYKAPIDFLSKAFPHYPQAAQFWGKLLGQVKETNILFKR